MPRITPSKIEYDKLLPKYEKTFTMTSHSFTVLDSNHGIDRSKVTRISGVAKYNTGQVVALSNYYQSDDHCIVYFEQNGNLCCLPGSTNPSIPFTLLVQIWYDD